MRSEYKLFDNFEEGVIVADKNGLIEDINNSIIDIFGYKKKELIGKSLSMLMFESEAKNHAELIKEFLNSGRTDPLKKGKEVYGKDKKNNYVPIYIWVIKYTNLSTELKLVGFIRKITNLEPDMIDVVAHEIITPLSNVALAVDSISKNGNELNPVEKEKIYSIMNMNVNLLIDMTEDLLLISRIENEKLFLEKTKVNLQNILYRVLNQLNVKIQEKNIKIQIKASDNSFINGDKKRIAQIFRILLDNAIKYSHFNSEIMISITKSEETSIKIKDQGLGIPETDISNLFKKFYRAKNVSHIKGTGLGLVIAKQLISLHKGSINVKSKLNEGSEFEIIFPAI